MNKAIPLLILLLCAPHQAHAVNEMWTSATQANVVEALQSGDTVFSQYKNKVDAQSCSYDDYGLQHAIMFKATGKPAYCAVAYSQNGGCLAGANRNKTRDCFVERALAYSICGNHVSDSNRSSWENQLDAVLDLVQSSSHGTRTWDTDELNGHYFGGTIYCLAKDGNLSRCNTGGHGASWGGVDATGKNRSTLRNAINDYYSDLSGGTFVEGSEYNKNTLYYMLQGVNAINDFYGTDKFPEITKLFDELAEFHVQYHVPGFSENFQFGDIQTIGNRNDYRVRGLYAAMAHLDGDDPVMWHLWDQIYADSCVRMGWGMFYDHNAKRQAPQGQTDFFAEGAGIQLWHEGWENKYESFFVSMMKPRSFADHDANGWSNFNLWRNGDWAVYNGKGYYGSLYAEANYLNTMMVNGGLPYVWQEARGTHVHEEGANYAYHVGLTGGTSMYSNYYSPPPQSLHEWTRSHFYYKHSDDSDTIIVFDRVNAQNPQNLSAYDRHTSEMRNFINAADGKHRVLFQAASNPTKIDSRITWYADNSEVIYLDTFITDVEYLEENMNGTACSGCGGNMGTNNPTLDYRIVLQSPSASRHQAFGNIIHAGSTPVTEEFGPTAGENARGFQVQAGVDNLIVLFNGTDRTADLPASTTTSGDREMKDPNMFDKLKVLHYFTEGFSTAFTTDGSAKVFILDLDPDKNWVVSIDGADYQSLNVSDAGLAALNISSSGKHTVSVKISGSLDDFDPVDTSTETPTDTNTDTSSDTTDPVDTPADTTTDTTEDPVLSPDSGSAAGEACDADCHSCDTEFKCLLSADECHWWSDNSCHWDPEGTTSEAADETPPAEQTDPPVEVVEEEPELTCADDIDECRTATECEARGFTWCNNRCTYAKDKVFTVQDSCNCNTNNTESLSCECVVTECENQAMVIVLGREGWKDTDPNTLTWGATSALDNLIGSDEYWFRTGEIELYYILDPEPGEHALKVTYDDKSNVDINMGMYTFCGVEQQPPENTAEGDLSIEVVSKTTRAGIISAVSSIRKTDFTPINTSLQKGWENDNVGFSTAVGFYQAPNPGRQECHWDDAQNFGDRAGGVCAAFEVAETCR